MEISRQFKPAIAIPTETAPARPAGVRPAAQPAARQAESLPLEQMHDALRAMPEVDLDRVAAIKQALQRGEISTDVGELASSMLSYHRGNDA
ncbi:flagellar biosynthesis anti-sigma factor FlgM [Pseudomonas sp. KSR10]|jgi:negative regulator of flagellin synthesis FlgM|uniref:Negative regulator of flagellin synthesis n=1 Tax=Stutzerimonas stutzeri TaxID=316 RepID=A0A0D9AVP9_STUST|nr:MULTISPECIES: flagellar biosynthesis anti-sigma factor FlgM [Pseudomonadaceae]KJH84812.1 flagellar biosynthesis anti-sigma factor FlgM [Stutzerimonas stutzeri]MCG6542900.1 flagellar biosynthesis anti-sigma factor FlgM [Pseudomonas sp. KSR10]